MAPELNDPAQLSGHRRASTRIWARRSAAELVGSSGMASRYLRDPGIAPTPNIGRIVRDTRPTIGALPAGMAKSRGCLASRMRWASPPDSVAAARDSDKYTGVFDKIRTLFAATTEAKVRGTTRPILVQRQRRPVRGMHRRRNHQDRPEGGTVVAEGTPENIAAVPESYTGKFLAETLHSHGAPTNAPRKTNPHRKTTA
jgi:hypothetical protein